MSQYADVVASGAEGQANLNIWLRTSLRGALASTAASSSDS